MERNRVIAVRHSQGIWSSVEGYVRAESALPAADVQNVANGASGEGDDGVLDFGRRSLHCNVGLQERRLDLEELEAAVDSVGADVVRSFDKERTPCSVVGVVEPDAGGDRAEVLSLFTRPRDRRGRPCDVSRLELLGL